MYPKTKHKKSKSHCWLTGQGFWRFFGLGRLASGGLVRDAAAEHPGAAQILGGGKRTRRHLAWKCGRWAWASDVKGSAGDSVPNVQVQRHPSSIWRELIEHVFFLHPERAPSFHQGHCATAGLFGVDFRDPRIVVVGHIAILIPTPSFQVGKLHA